MRLSIIGPAFLAMLLISPSGSGIGLAQEKSQPPSAKKAEKLKADKPPAFVQAKDAGTDFTVQGEYESDPTAAGSGKFALQVVAKGDSKFEGKVFAPALPGKDPATQAVHDFVGTIADGKVKLELYNGNRAKGTIPMEGTLADGKLSLGMADGKMHFEAKKVERKSPTEGLKPPGNAIVLFDGPDDIKNWNGGKIKELSDGKFLAVGCKSKKAFTDYALHVEFRLPFMPKSGGQGRANSGVYMQDRYEVQVLDSFGLKGLNNECGGIYTIAAPKVNMCYPPLSWQTYDIDFTAAKYEGDKKVKNAVITVRHNGVVVQDKQEIPKETGGGQKEGNTPGPIQLQDHGDPVVYRNIWIVEK